MAAIQTPIEQRNTGKGNPGAVFHFDRPLNNRQSRLLNLLVNFDDKAIVRKCDVTLSDLAALTAHTGVEFALFTRDHKRMIIRGSATMTNIDIALAEKMAVKGWRWSAHTHPGNDRFCLYSSEGDRSILSAFHQQESCIVNSIGMWTIFRGDD